MQPIDPLARLIFSLGGAVLAVALTAYSVVEVVRGDWRTSTTLILTLAGIGFTTLNWLLKQQASALGPTIHRLAWPVAGVFAVAMAFLHTGDIDIDAVVLPFGAGLCGSLAVALTLDRSSAEPSPPVEKSGGTSAP